MIGTINDRLYEQVEWLELHGKKPSRIELGQLAARQLVHEHQHIMRLCRERVVGPNTILDFSSVDRLTHGPTMLAFWCDIPVTCLYTFPDPWRAFVYCSDDPTENQ